MPLAAIDSMLLPTSARRFTSTTNSMVMHTLLSPHGVTEVTLTVLSGNSLKWERYLALQFLAMCRRKKASAG
jgi:hypothetical protein